MKPRLIDADCALAGQEIVNCAGGQIAELENHITKSLGVLIENGVYAFFLYQKTEHRQRGEYVLNGLAEFVTKFGFSAGLCGEQSLAATTEITNDLHRVLFLREILEKALVYARWQLKGAEAAVKRDDRTEESITL